MEGFTKRQERRGFNLIETAIVLGMVGIVIGGIWVGAATVSENIKVKKTIEGILAIARNIQSLISARDSIAIGNSINITSTLIQAEAYPKDWINGSTVKSPFGGNVTSANLSSPPRFGINLYSRPVAKIWS
jgi:type II secretory pathway pseudopilin PulG